MKVTLAFSAMLMIGLFSMIFPNVYAASGDITVDQSEFTLYHGYMITFPVIIEMSDYTYKPTLDIIHNGNLFQKILLHSIGDTFYSVIGLDENWASGKYLINLKYQGEILEDRKSVV